MRGETVRMSPKYWEKLNEIMVVRGQRVYRLRFGCSGEDNIGDVAFAHAPLQEFVNTLM